MELCDICGLKGFILESRPCGDGTRRRRRECPNGHRWSESIADAICRKCGCQGRTLESRVNCKGIRRRRYQCSNGHRWTTRTNSAAGVYSLQPLTEDQVRLILESGLGVAELSRIVRKSRSAIVHVLRGTSCRRVLPEIPRPRASDNVSPLRRKRSPRRKSCHRCQHWHGGCTMGFPDPAEEGPSFAMECALYDEQAAPLAA